MILEDSVEERIIVDWLEANMGYHNATIMVNAHRMDEGLEIIGRSAVINSTKRMLILITKVQKRNKGNKNYLAWVLARKNQCMQYMVMT